MLFIQIGFFSVHKTCQYGFSLLCLYCHVWWVDRDVIPVKKTKGKKTPQQLQTRRKIHQTRRERLGRPQDRVGVGNWVHFLLSFLLLRLEATKLVRIPARCRSEPAASLSSSSTSDRESLLLLFPKSWPCSGLRGHRARASLSWSWCKLRLKLTGCERGIWRGQGGTGVLL